MKGTSFDKKPNPAFDKKPTAKSSVKGNTLDYYNDDMSRKAVGKLFSSSRDDADELNIDFEDDYETTTEPGKAASANGVSSTVQKKDSETSSITGENNEYIDLDELETYIQKKHVNISSVFNDPSDDDYDISLYQGKKKDGTSFTASSKANPAAVRPPARTPAAPSKNISPSSKPALRNGKDSDIKPEKKSKLNTFDADSDHVSKAALVSGELNSQIKIAGFVIIVVFLIILTALVFKMRSLSASLDEANEIAAKYNPETEKELNEWKIWYNGLKDENDSLRAELELALASAVQTESPSNAINNQTPSPQNTDNTNQSATPVPQGERTHTVVAGDNLTKISIQYYQSAAHVDRIKTANGLTSDAIHPGQVLKIPQ